MTPPSSGASGRIVGGRYRLLSILGTGGMGVVWTGLDEVLQRDVAVKELIPPAGISAEQKALLTERSMREARAAARLRSDAAVTVFDVVEEDGRPWIVMELLHPGTLADLIRDEGRQPPQRVAAVGLRLLDALDAAARVGVLHRDVKPGNVLFRPDGRAVLTDFGIASMEGDSSITMTGTVLGSPAFVAPERARGHEPTAASDLWSLGITLFAAVEGRTPFERDTPLATLAAVLEGDIPYAEHAGPLAPVLQGLLRRDPAQRMNVAQARALLENAASAPAPPHQGTQPTQSLQHPPTAAAVRGPQVSGGEGADKQTSGTATSGSVAGGAVLVREPAAVDSEPRKRGGLLAGAAAVVLLLLAAVVFALNGNDTPTSGAASDARPASTPSAAEPTAAPPPVPTTAPPAPSVAPATPAASTPPAGSSPPEEEDDEDDEDNNAAGGFRTYEDDAYSVDVPEGWAVDQESPARTVFRDPGSGRFLLVEEGGKPKGDPVRDWQRQENGVSRRLDGYERIRIDRADLQQADDAADWEFTWNGRNGRMHVLNRAVIDDGKAYALYWSVPEDDWQSSRDEFRHITRSFRPR